jgi:hypothetical protein
MLLLTDDDSEDVIGIDEDQMLLRPSALCLLSLDEQQHHDVAYCK